MRRVPLTILRWVMVVLFFGAGVDKLIALGKFEGSLRAMAFFPDSAIPVLAWAVPASEIVAGLLVGLRVLEPAGLVAMAFLSLTFAGLHAYIYAFGLTVPCGCTGLMEARAGETDHLVTACVCAAAFVAASVLARVSDRRRPRSAG